MATAIDLAIDIRHLRAQKAIRLLTDLMRGPIVHAQRLRPPSHIHAERLPREGLLENALAKITGKEQSIRPAGGESGKKAQFGDADVLRFVHHRSIVGRRCVRDR